MYRAAFILTVIGAILLVIAIVLPFVFPMLFESQITKKLIIQPNSEMMKSFVETPVPIYFQIWFFNLTNVESVIDGEKPILKQFGPYTYRQKRIREDIGWNDELGTVLFKQKKFYYFEPSLSQGRETDLITTVNPVFISLASKLSADSIPAAAKSLAQLWFLRFGNKPFMTHPVKELLFDGYDEPLLGELYALTKDPSHKMAKFGFFIAKNGSADGEVEIFSGQQGMSNYQHIHRWHGKKNLDFWKSEECNMINGTDGAQFPKPISKSKPLYLFSAELCRSIHGIYEQDVKLGPLTLQRYILPSSLLANSQENDCYCVTNFTCQASMIDVSPCRKGSPVIISTPHFYQGDSEYQNAVEGLNPNKEEHETFLDVEPNTGVTMRVAKRIQINMPLKKYGNLPSLYSIKEVIMPILWVNESVEIPMDRVEKLHLTLTVPVIAVTYGSWALLASGILLVFIAFLLTMITYRKNSELRNRRQELSDRKLRGNNDLLMEKKLYEVS